VPYLLRPAQIQKMSSILENFEFPSDTDGELKSHKVRSKQFLGGKVCHERTKANPRCNHSQEVLALESCRIEPVGLWDELPTVAGPEEFLASLRPIPRDRSQARAQRGVGLLATCQARSAPREQSDVGQEMVRQSRLLFALRHRAGKANGARSNQLNEYAGKKFAPNKFYDPIVCRCALRRKD
jgi:hypothetical protein